MPPSAYSYNFSFCFAQIDLRIARERELAILDEKSTISVTGIKHALKPCRRQVKQTLERIPPQNSKL